MTNQEYRITALQASFNMRSKYLGKLVIRFFEKFGNEATERVLDELDALRGRLWAEQQEKEEK